MASPPDGWRDPAQRALRSAAVAVILGLMVWVVVVESGANDISAVATLGGFLLVILGFGGPKIGRK